MSHYLARSRRAQGVHKAARVYRLQQHFFCALRGVLFGVSYLAGLLGFKEYVEVASRRHFLACAAFRRLGACMGGGKAGQRQVAGKTGGVQCKRAPGHRCVYLRYCRG